MRALVYIGPDKLELREESVPNAVDGEVVIKVEAVGICGSDMHAYHGHDSRRPAPLILGHEAAGRIVSGPRAGERVTINPLIVDPACPYAIEGRGHLRRRGKSCRCRRVPCAFAEFVRVPERNVESIPDHLPIEHAALAEPIAVSVARGLLAKGERRHSPLAAARVIVLGGGAIDLTSASQSRHFGATT